RLRFESTTGLVEYRAFETTDLDLSADPDLTRRNLREGRQYTEEIRLVPSSPLELFPGWTLHGQAGLFGFIQKSRQHVTNFIAPAAAPGSLGTPTPGSGGAVGPLLALPIAADVLAQAIDSLEDRTRSRLDDAGLGVYLQTTAEIREAWSVTLGLRYDR